MHRGAEHLQPRYPEVEYAFDVCGSQVKRGSRTILYAKLVAWNSHDPECNTRIEKLQNPRRLLGITLYFPLGIVQHSFTVVQMEGSPWKSFSTFGESSIRGSLLKRGIRIASNKSPRREGVQ